jgi:phospholipase C
MQGALCVLAVLMGLLSIQSCGTGTAAPAVVGPAVSISASPTSIAAGSSTTLTVTVSNASSVVITDNVDTNKYSIPAGGGTQKVSPTSTTVYTVTATGSGGSSTATVTVTVTGPVVTITANPTQIAYGSKSTLTVTATGATTVVITDNVDSTKYTLAATGGTQVVTPNVTTTYTATATGPSGTTTATATVTVSAPTVTITANPTQVMAGGSSTLTVTATGAATVVVTDNVDSNKYTLAATGGTQVVTPSVTTTYTATATAPSGTTTATVTVTVLPSVTITANPARIATGSSSTLTVVAVDATSVVITDNVDSNSYTLTATGGQQVVSPTATTIYTATATGPSGTSTATATVTVVPAGTVNSVNHVLFMLQENRTFDTYFGMLNPYRKSHSTSGQAWNVGDDGNTYNVDGIDDKLNTSNEDDEGTSFKLFHTVSSCLDDMTSSWLESYGDVSRYDFTPTRRVLMDGFVHTAENYAKDAGTGVSVGEGSFTDFTGQRAMAYYEDTAVSGKPELNYYYYMASQFAVSDRWFSPVSTKTVPNRIATMTGGTTQGLVFDPFSDDKLKQTLSIQTIFQELDTAKVSWKIYYTLTEGNCDTKDGDCGTSTGLALYPVTSFSDFGYSGKYLYSPPPCVAPTEGSKQAVGDASNSFCIDPSHIAPLSQLFTDFTSGTLPSFAYIEPGYGLNDEHPGSGQSILTGQTEVANILNKLMASPSWADSVFFLSFDEAGGPYDHVPPVPGHTNDYTDASLGITTDIKSIAVNPDTTPPYWPCLDNGPVNSAGNPTPTLHCDLNPGDPGAHSGDAPAVEGFAAQLGFRVPNLVISPFTRRHYVGHNPMDHTAILKFVESRFINSSAHLTNRDAAQPDLLDFFDFTAIPWLTPPSTVPAPPSVGSTCTPTTMQ